MYRQLILFIILLQVTACADRHENKIHSFHKTIDTQHKNKMGISIYYQKENTIKPTLYFLAASTSDRRSYEHIYHYLANKGYVVVGLSTEGFASDFMSYHFYDAISYARRVCKKKGLSDDKQIGLIGHSSGAGVLPSLAYKLFTEDKLGEDGRFIFGASPWIDFQFKNFMKLPKDTNFVTQLFEDDHSTDPRIYLDIYKLMDVNHKTFMMVKQGGNHQTPFYDKPKELVQKGVYEPIENLASFTFFKKDKEKIFSSKKIITDYVDIEAEGTLPSNKDYKQMLNAFIRSRSSFGCKPTSNYAPNPREKECLNYQNR
ncbi:MAG: Chlorophyllase [uncultured Sulfurovum sp.]|uniref:Chlorophyllase n=1 Tax=uncultured Sulfurovum sp. TaxID=269237 RepID=A0A6S6TC71_9BACT|nr:MAG: Chlorophyllase [uncultured Sulfurovum sp.]